MMNPFKKDGEMLPVASINSVFVDDVKAYDLFRPEIILQELILHKDKLAITHIPENVSLLHMFNSLLNHDLDSVKTVANDIAVKYGNRLAKIIGTLFKPSLQSITNRENWHQVHWDFWQTIEQIYFVGGLTSPILTHIFYEQMMLHFKQLNINNVQVSFIEGSQNLGTSGLATLIENGEYLLFDFGQTSIKRSYHVKTNGRTDIESYLDPIESQFLFYKTDNQVEVEKLAEFLDDYIIEVILTTMNEVAYTGQNIYMSIANYVSNGSIYSSRGGYGKLAYIADNYQTHLEQRLQQILHKKIAVRLFHDTSAMALLFKDKPNTAVISLGTAFGVAFPE